MKLLLIFLAATCLGATASAGPLVVHEWGTFTSVSGSDGVLLPGLEREELAVPPFVHSHAGFSPANKGWNRPVANVTIKMETPVLYFYSDVPRTVTVDVAFHGGSISQWYPERSGGESLAGLAQAVGMSPLGEFLGGSIPAIDFAKGYQGSASWRVDVLPPGATDEISAKQKWETPELTKTFASIAQWPRARVSGANKVRGPGPGPDREVEGFIFYRGIGNFPLPLKIKAVQGNLVLSNLGAQSIPFLFVYEKRAGIPQGMVWWSGDWGRTGAFRDISAGAAAGGPDVGRSAGVGRHLAGELFRPRGSAGVLDRAARADRFRAADHDRPETRKIGARVGRT
jgi:hypothetical protein